MDNGYGMYAGEGAAEEGSEDVMGVGYDDADDEDEDDVEHTQHTLTYRRKGQKGSLARGYHALTVLLGIGWRRLWRNVEEVLDVVAAKGGWRQWWAHHHQNGYKGWFTREGWCEVLYTDCPGTQEMQQAAADRPWHPLYMRSTLSEQDNGQDGEYGEPADTGASGYRYTYYNGQERLWYGGVDYGRRFLEAVTLANATTTNETGLCPCNGDVYNTNDEDVYNTNDENNTNDEPTETTNSTTNASADDNARRSLARKGGIEIRPSSAAASAAAGGSRRRGNNQNSTNMTMCPCTYIPIDVCADPAESGAQKFIAR
jgi:hypothetical protein